MNTHTQKTKIRLGLFVIGGLSLFVFAVFIIGRQKSFFNPVFNISATFHNVSGLQVGNNIRFLGINVGTVDDIIIIDDSTVRINMLIRRKIRRFIKSDCKVSIGSEGIIGDKQLVISQGSSKAPVATEGQILKSTEPIETEAIVASLQITADNAEIITGQLAEIMIKINKGEGTLGRLIQDKTIAENLNQTIVNLKRSSKGLDENMTAAKHNFLFKGYFDKKEKQAKEDRENKKKAGQKKR